MKKETLTFLIFLATIAIITVPLGLLTSAASTDTFDVDVTITNSAPTISSVDAIADITPNAGTTKQVSLYFNATDINGVTDFNLSSVTMNISRSGETSRLSTVCWSVANVTNTQRFGCNVTISYYDAAGDWDICAYVRDLGSSAVSDCTSANLDMHSLDDVTVINASIAFSGVAGATDVGPAHVVINNSGNIDYTGVSITAQNLTGAVSLQIINVANFSVNVTDAATGQALIDGTPVAITSAVLASPAIEDLYFYIDIPSGLQDDTYAADSNWAIDPTGP